MEKYKAEAPTATELTLSLDDARNVMWLKSNYRPMGELFDEGFLNQKRLEWAVEYAYDKRIQQAAKVLLLEIKDTPSRISLPTQFMTSDNLWQIDITLEQARKTLWPLMPFKGQEMGSLVETKQLSLKDLGYAIENAWDERVRQAATTLSLIRMKQAIKEPPPPAGPLNVITGGRSYAEKQQDKIILFEGMILGGFLTLLIALVVFLIVRQVSTSPTKTLSKILAEPYGIYSVIIAFGLCIVAGLLFSYIPAKTIERLDKERDNYHLGEVGEDRVEEIIRQSLDGHWYLFRNVVLPGRNKGDIDGVLVGPAGVWILEIKNFHGEYRNIGDRWEYRSGKVWKPAKVNPSQQALNNAIRLGNFLKADGNKQWVTPSVVWANVECPVIVENPVTAVWNLDRLPDELGNLWSNQPIADKDLMKIVDKFSKLSKMHENETK